jgi:hypothetical protein
MGETSVGHENIWLSVIAAVVGSILGGLAGYTALQSTGGDRPKLAELFLKQGLYLISAVALVILFAPADPRISFAIGLTIPAFVQSISKQWVKGFDSERVAQLKETISKAEAAVEAEPEKTRPVWDLSRAQLELYINRNLSQVRNIFWITIAVMACGFGMIVYGVYRAFEEQIQAAILTTTSGLITQAIGATFLLIYRSTMRQASEYVGTLERINAVGMAVAIVDLIPDDKGDAKTKARVDLVKQLLANAPKQVHARDG